MPLPTLIYNGLTKTGNEMHVYIDKCPGRMLYQKTYVHGSGMLTFNYQASCGQGFACPHPLEATILTSCNNNAIGGVPPAGIPADSPMYTAMVGHNEAFTGNGVSVLWAEIPDFDYATLVCYDQGGNPTPGLPFRPIPRKFNPVDHYVRIRPENRITLSELFVSNWDGLQQVKGCPCTVILALMPSGAGAYQEIHYFCNTLLNPNSFNWGAEGNDSQTISLEGSFSFCAILSAAKPY